MKIFSAICFLSMLASTVVLADSYTLRNDQTGRTFYCSEDPTDSPDLSSCIREISTVCKKSKGSYSDAVCYSEAKDHCKNASPGFGRCVTGIWELCKQAKGSYSEAVCYSEALTTCKQETTR